MLGVTHQWGNPLQELDQKLFNKAVDFGHLLLNKGYAKAWFTWVEWVTLSAFMYVAGVKLEAFNIKIIAGFSFMVVFFVGLAAVERFTSSKIQNFNGKPGRAIIFALVVNLTGLFIVFNVVWSIIEYSNV
jgi:hypothetical protein